MYTDIINQNSDRLLQLISDILDLSQIEAGSFDFHYSKFNANDLLRELYALFNIRLVEKPEGSDPRSSQSWDAEPAHR